MSDRPGEFATHIATLEDCVAALDRLAALAGEIPAAVEATARAMVANDLAGIEAGKARLDEIHAAVRALAAPGGPAPIPSAPPAGAPE